MSQTATAEVIENLEYQYYEVNVAANQSLRSALNQASTIRQDGKTHHGYTKWHVRWHFHWNNDHSGHCKIVSSKTTLQGNILLPRLAYAPLIQRKQFDRYMIALREHELGHYKIGQEAAKAIDEQFSSVPSSSTCKALEKPANDRAYQILEKYKLADKEYDAKTIHGKTQGAWLD